MFTDFNVSDDDDTPPKPGVGTSANLIPVQETPTVSRKSVDTSKNTMFQSSPPEPDMDEALLASVLGDCEEEEPGAIQVDEAGQGGAFWLATDLLVSYCFFLCCLHECMLSKVHVCMSACLHECVRACVPVLHV